MNALAWCARCRQETGLSEARDPRRSLRDSMIMSLGHASRQKVSHAGAGGISCVPKWRENVRERDVPAAQTPRSRSLAARERRFPRRSSTHAAHSSQTKMPFLAVFCVCRYLGGNTLSWQSTTATLTNSSPAHVVYLRAQTQRWKACISTTWERFA